MSERIQSTADDDMEDRFGRREPVSKWMPKKLTLSGQFTCGVSVVGLDYAQNQFDIWYDKEIRPLFENAVEVRGKLDGNKWSMPIYEGYYHTGLVINIKPIGEETPEDLLREIVTMWYKGGQDFDPKKPPAMERARLYFERKK